MDARFQFLRGHPAFEGLARQPGPAASPPGTVAAAALPFDAALPGSGTIPQREGRMPSGRPFAPETESLAAFQPTLRADARHRAGRPQLVPASGARSPAAAPPGEAFVDLLEASAARPKLAPLSGGEGRQPDVPPGPAVRPELLAGYLTAPPCSPIAPRTPSAFEREAQELDTLAAAYREARSAYREGGATPACTAIEASAARWLDAQDALRRAHRRSFLTGRRLRTGAALLVAAVLLIGLA